eukprot:1015843-Prorocentrum_minimum.AAC.2
MSQASSYSEKRPRGTRGAYAVWAHLSAPNSVQNGTVSCEKSDGRVESLLAALVNLLSVTRRAKLQPGLIQPVHAKG